MQIWLAFLAASALLVQALSLEYQGLGRRAFTCSSVFPSMNADLAKATSFCKVFLQISPRTFTSTSTITSRTITVSKAVYTTTVLSITPPTQAQIITKQVRQTVRTTPALKTVTTTLTSTAYVDPNGQTIAVRKRSEPTPVLLAERAIATPSYLKGMSKAGIRAACQCLEIPTPTITQRKTALATATVTKILNRKVIKTTTLPTPLLTNTFTSTRLIVVTAATPRATETAYNVVNVNSCPPTRATSWLCPEQTGDDNGIDAHYLNCTVTAFDGFSGSCLYWRDDGAPAASTLILGDGSGDPDNDETRDAVYGDEDTDDCPSWADWTCSASSGVASDLDVSQEYEVSKRGYIPKAIGPAQHRKQGKKTMPNGIRRGGKYVLQTPQGTHQ